MPRLTPLLAATSSIAVIVAAYLWQQLHAERALSAQLQERVTQLEIGQQRSGQSEPVAHAAGSLARATDTPAAAPVAGVATAPPPAAKTAATNVRKSISINIAELLKDPDFREAQRAQMRMQMPQNYPDLAKELGLTPAEADAFFDLLSKQQINQMANSYSSDASDDVRQAAQRASADLARTQQAELESQLGATKYQQWKDYQQTLGARQQVSQLRTTLASAGVPLADDQAKPLLATLTAEQQRRSDEARSRTYPTDPAAQLDFEDANLKATEDSNNRVLDAAQSYLNTQQLAALKNSMTQQLGMTRAFAKARRAQMESGGQPAGGAASTGMVTVFSN